MKRILLALQLEIGNDVPYSMDERWDPSLSHAAGVVYECCLDVAAYGISATFHKLYLPMLVVNRPYPEAT